MEKRKYKSYSQYLSHQRSKMKALPEKEARLIKNWERKRDEFYWLFHDMLPTEVLTSRCTVACLGARKGEEVAAFSDLGFKAVGFDVVPCLPLVKEGDMNNLSLSKRVDMIFSNSVDHVWDLEKFLDNCVKNLKKRGILFLHLALGLEIQKQEWEAFRVDSPQEVLDLLPDHEVLLSKRKKFHGLNHVLIIRLR